MKLTATITVELDPDDLEELVHWRDWLQESTDGDYGHIYCSDALRAIIRRWRTIAEIEEDDGEGTDSLVAAAKHVVDTRYGGGDGESIGWELLNEAIGQLGDTLKAIGVKCKRVS